MSSCNKSCKCCKVLEDESKYWNELIAKLRALSEKHQKGD